jgi:hypothetical protein
MDKDKEREYRLAGEELEHYVEEMARAQEALEKFMEGRSSRDFDRLFKEDPMLMVSTMSAVKKMADSEIKYLRRHATIEEIPGTAVILLSLKKFSKELDALIKRVKKRHGR